MQMKLNSTAVKLIGCMIHLLHCLDIITITELSFVQYW